MREQSFQTKVSNYLKRKGCYVIKINQDAKSKTGDPDLVAFKQGWWGWLEVKKSKNEKRQPLQPEKIKWANENSYGRIVWPEIWPEVQKELEDLLRD